VFALLGGIGLATVSVGGDAAGFVLDATGIGAVVGVPLNAVSTAGLAAGAAVAGSGATSIIRAAAGPDRVTVMQASSNDGGGGAGDGGGGSSDTPHTKQEVASQAKDLGYGQRVAPQKVPFNSHGQPAFWNGKVYISPDVDGHNVYGWKMFSRGGDRIGTYNWDLSTRVKN
jgi:hypothetical protein